MRYIVIATLPIALLASAASPGLSAQSSLPVDRSGFFATRSVLEDRAEAASRVAGNPDARGALRRQKAFEATMLRSRLTEGDFLPGDEVVILVQGEPALSDTFTVRSGRTISLPSLTEIDLSGVLRSELQSHVTAQIARFVREPRVQTTPLVRLAVLGQVGRPGFYALPADALVTDAIMHAGGPGPDADLSRTEIRRGASELWSSGDVRIAIADGLTLDQLNLRAGDEIVIGERRRWDAQSTMQIVGALTGIVALAFSFSR